MNRAQRRRRAKLIHGTPTDQIIAATRADQIHKCNQDCIVKTVERPAARRRLIAAAVAISIIVPVIVIVLLAAATYLFGK